MTGLSELLAKPFSGIFVGYDENLLELTAFAFSVYAFSFLLEGFNVFSSGFFTALNNGLISGVLSFSRVLGFQLPAVLVMPVLLGINGIWSSIIVSEICAGLLVLFFLVKNKNRYHYI